MLDLSRDLRQALRSLVRSPGFSLLVVLTMALGIGAGTAVFSVVNAVLLRPLPYPHPERLVRIESVRGGERGQVSLHDLRDIEEGTSLFTGVASYTGGDQYNTSGDGTAPEDGEILSRERYVPSNSYEEWFSRVFAASRKDDPRDPDLDPVAMRSYYTRSLFDTLAQAKDVETEKLTYASDGLKIRGFLVRPKRASGRYPVILWCRGGNRDYGTVKLGDLLLMSNWARRGYVVLASNYRGSTGSEGRDEIGGDDVHDVEALIPLARSLPYADLDNVFLYGQSRGGMMVYRALAEGIPVRAAVVNSGVSDLEAGLKDRPEMDEDYRATMPDYAQERAGHFCRRSAVCWPEKITKPVLILHGTADWRVRPDQALTMAAKLQSAGRPYSLRIFEGGVHVDLVGGQAALDTIVLEYFESHRAAHPIDLKSDR